MQMSLVKRGVLFNLNYKQVRTVCDIYPTNLEFEIWREKALIDFNISYEFFSLVSELSPYQRYLQLKFYKRVEGGDVAEGICEPTLAFINACLQGNINLIKHYFCMLTDEQVKSLHSNENERVLAFLTLLEGRHCYETPELLWASFLFGKISLSYLLRKNHVATLALLVEQNLYFPTEEREILYYFNNYVRAGRRDIVDKFLPYVLSLPLQFSLERDPLASISFCKSREGKTLQLAKKMLSSAVNAGMSKLCDLLYFLYSLKFYPPLDGGPLHNVEETYHVQLRHYPEEFRSLHLAEFYRPKDKDKVLAFASGNKLYLKCVEIKST